MAHHPNDPDPRFILPGPLQYLGLDDQGRAVIGHTSAYSYKVPRPRKFHVEYDGAEGYVIWNVYPGEDDLDCTVALGEANPRLAFDLIEMASLVLHPERARMLGMTLLALRLPTSRLDA